MGQPNSKSASAQSSPLWADCYPCGNKKQKGITPTTSGTPSSISGQSTSTGSSPSQPTTSAQPPPSNTGYTQPSASVKIPMRPSASDYVLMAAMVHFADITDPNTLRASWLKAGYTEAHWTQWEKSGWTVVHSVKNTLGGYSGQAYYHPQLHQLVIAHASAPDQPNLSGTWATLEGVMANMVTLQQIGSWLFTQAAMEQLTKNHSVSVGPELLDVQMSFTGFGLGAWLAEVCAGVFLNYTDKNIPKEGLAPWAVTFESPGSAPILKRLAKTNIQNQPAFLLSSCDITAYVTEPNVFNSCNIHVGDMIEVSLPSTAPPITTTFAGGVLAWLYNHTLGPMTHTQQTHALQPLVEALLASPSSRLKRVTSWPSIVERGSQAINRVFQVTDLPGVDQLLQKSVKWVRGDLNKGAPPVGIPTNPTDLFAAVKKLINYFMEVIPQGVRYFEGMCSEKSSSFYDWYQAKYQPTHSPFPEWEQRFFLQYQTEDEDYDGRRALFCTAHPKLHKFLQECEYLRDAVKIVEESSPDKIKPEEWNYLEGYRIDDTKPSKWLELFPNNPAQNTAEFVRWMTSFYLKNLNRFTIGKIVEIQGSSLDTRVEGIVQRNVEKLKEAENKKNLDEVTTNAKHWLQRDHEKTAIMTSPFRDTWTLHDQGRYVNLAILEEQVQKERENHHLTTSSSNQDSDHTDTQGLHEQLLTNFEGIYDVKKPIELKQLWETRQQLPERSSDSNLPLARFLMVLGRAGVGKSTCCKYMALMHETLWPGKFDYVFYIPWRSLSTALGFNARMTLSQLLFQHLGTRYAITPQNWEKFYDDINKQPDKVLLLLDGYDELTRQQLDTTTSLEEATIVNELLHAPFYKLLTSRPYGTERLNPDARFEITGFTNTNIETYINYYFESKTTAQDVYTYIHSNLSIWGIAHIPITCELLCWSWKKLDEKPKKEDRDKENLKNDFTLTQLYYSIITELLRSYLEKKQTAAMERQKVNRTQKGDEALLQIQDISKLTKIRVWKLSEPVLRFLSELARTGLEEGNLLIHEDLIERCRIREENSDNIFDDALLSGLIKSTDSTHTATQQSVYFIHLTFQEFFAAYALTGSLITEHTNFFAPDYAAHALKEIQYKPRYQIVMWFCAGLWDLPDEHSPWSCPSDPNRLWAVLLKPPRDLSLVYDASILARCIEEAAQTRKMRVQPKDYQDAIIFVTQLLTGLAKNHAVYPDSLTRALAICPHYMATHGLPAELAVYKANPSPGGKIIDHASADIRSTRLITWSQLGAVVFREGCCVLKECLDALQEDSSWPVRSTAGKTLGTVFPALNANQQTEALQAIIKATQDPETAVRENTCMTLETMFPTLNANQQIEAFQALILATNDKESRVQSQTLISLRTAYPTLNENQKNQVLAALIAAMLKTDWVRTTALKVLKTVSPKHYANQQTQAFPTLIQDLANPAFEARQKAFRILSNAFSVLDASQQDEAFPILINAVTQDPKDEIKEAAIWGLDAIISTLHGNEQREASQTLIDAAKNTNDNVRWIACRTLGKQFTALSTSLQPEAFEALITAMRSPQRLVQKGGSDGLQAAFPALNKSQKNRALSTVFQALDQTLKETSSSKLNLLQVIFMSALRQGPLERLICHHLEVDLPTAVLGSLVYAVWKARSALAVESGQLVLYQPHELSTQQVQVPPGISARLIQERIETLQRAFETKAGLRNK